MALVRFSGGIGDIRGSIGGTTFSKNRYGNYARGRITPVNPNSSAQQAVRNDMGAVVSLWFSGLSAVQRAAWAVYAAGLNFTNKLGESITLTGFNHFVRSNIARKSNGMTVVTTAPVEISLPPTDSEFAVDVSEASQLMTVNFDDAADWCAEDSAYMSIHQGLPQNSACGFFGGHFRRIGNILGNSGSPPTSPQTIALTFPAAVTQKDWAFGRVQRADGRLSEKFRDDCIVGS